MMMVERDSARTAGVGSWEATEASRRIADLFRAGKVVEVSYGDPTAPRLRVGVGDPDDPDNYMLSGWLPLMGGRAGNGESHWDAPEVGEAVTVLSECGELQNGVVMAGSIYSEANPAAGTAVGLYRRRFKDGSVMEYDRATKTMLFDATAAGTMILRAGGCEIELKDGVVTLKAGEFRGVQT